MELPEDIRAMNFEDALSALEQIVQNLESGDVSLENSIEIYTRGTQLRQHCDEKLKDASERIEKITRQQSGALATEPLDVE
ncbi:exodeoxyribonuclease VII small subunit [Emcibacter nanhaiensis]|uniref:Exodeoxyribonuclease 7 small subunit n=2 Tax=Emcibacter nanhaiensis TaxID=1505037 RepID=A0A501PCQ9_9PROT|nr:exodeoxyribonuclease VII small subunit [Emcibacter nanhaiensis]